MNHYAKGLVVLLVLFALSISGVYADVTSSMATNGNIVTQTVPSGSSINQAIAINSGALSGTNQITGPYFFSDFVRNLEEIKLISPQPLMERQFIRMARILSYRRAALVA